MLRKLTLLLLLLLAIPFAAAQEARTQLDTPPDPADYQLLPVVTGLTRPLYMTMPDDDTNRMFVLEQAGRIWIIEDGAPLSFPFLDVSDRSSQDVTRSYSERGLLGMAFDPDYAENGIFYIHYNAIRDGSTVISRYRTAVDNPNQADAASEQIIFTLPQPYPNHNGGQIAFGPDGYLYVGLGDGGSAGDPLNAGQDPQTLLGKILRLDVRDQETYTIPENNPAFTINPDLLPETWAWGLRNPWRFSFDRATGDLYIADVGQSRWEEINFEPAGSEGGFNYGWRPYEGSHPYSGEPAPDPMVLPVAEYDHSLGCSVTGGYVYRGEALPALDGVYFYGDWCSGRIWAAFRDAAGEWQSLPFLQSGRSISSFGQDAAGEIYVVDYNRGEILLLTAR